MLLLEFAAQGVRGLSSAAATVRLRPGYNVLPAEGVALRRLLLALLHPEPGDAEALRAGPGAVRGGLTVLGDDGVTYRLVRDLAASGRQLQRLDAKRRAFTPAAGDPAAIADQLRVAGLPAPSRLELLTLRAEELPSRRSFFGRGPSLPARDSAAATVEVGPGNVAPADPLEMRDAAVPAALDPGCLSEPEERLESLQRRLFQLEQLVSERTRLQERAAEADAAAHALEAQAEVVARLGPPEEALASHGRATARRDEALAGIEAERASLEEAAASGAPVFWRRSAFWAGVVAGLAAVVAGVAGAGSAARYLALLDIPAFGWAAWVALGWVGALEERGRLDRRRALANEHERKVMETFERETAQAQQAMAALGVTTVRELEDALQRVAAVRVAAREAHEALDSFEARPEARLAGAEHAAVERELRAAERLATAGRSGPRAVPGPPAAPPARAAGALASGPGPSAAPAAAAQAALAGAAIPAPPEAAFVDLMTLATRELAFSPPVALALQRQASQALLALSGGRLSGLVLEGRNVALLASGARLPPAAMAPGDRDLAWLALKLALVERLLAAQPGFALVDDALGVVPQAARRATGQVLRTLARPGQLLHASSDPVFRDLAEQAS